MILTAHQPAYLPWLGYLDKLMASDVYVMLDSVQFEKGGYTNRNRIKTPQGPCWLTIPLHAKGHMDCAILDIRINNAFDWRSKHLRSIEMNYRRASNFDQVFPRLEQMLLQKHDWLIDATLLQHQLWTDLLGIKCQMLRSSELGLEQKKSGLVIEMCEKTGAKTYISGALGIDYLNVNDFSSRGINLVVQNYSYPEYKQQFGDFTPGLSIVDYVMNCDDFSRIKRTLT